ncbi:MAG TPA: 50S ribosomal protein L11 methyltransferase [Caulobacterales bacterium]|nr:50S ribosomal protein L11 methyltransferase [Caulobacterales bacterium]
MKAVTDAEDRTGRMRGLIARRAPVAAAPGVPEIRLHQAQPTSGLSRLADAGGTGETPFWAFAWAGGIALARHVLDHPHLVAGRCVLDLGTGSGLVAIAAAKAGARAVFASDVDPAAIAATELNAAINGVAVASMQRDVTPGAPPPGVSIVLAGDVFYDRALARRMLAFLQRCAASGIDVLIGDPDRAPLPRNVLRRVARYQTGDVGEPCARPSYIYALRRLT